MSSSAKPKSKSKKQSAPHASLSSSGGKKKSTDSLPSSAAGSVSTSTSKVLSSGFLLTCDPPAKQFILHLNDTKIADKKFILEDLDSTHLLIKGDVQEEITRKVEEWMDENVFSNVERVGENLDNS
ncbi:hypothetical protein HJC23_002946 [Cyclotella cryptica]|uniref:General transcription and DNA repair factor IIH subunit TFB5 n=1 Tax=Cyclotella cryptica TaxID=29204 RepID=A0ABD3PVR2_9STRA